MTGLHVSAELSRTSVSRTPRQGLVGIPPAVQEVAHDMHSPLNSILFLAETLQRGGSGPVTDMQRRQLGLICTAALGLSSVGSDIIDFTRSDKLLEPTPVPFSVTTVLEAVRDIVRPMAGVRNLTVSVEPPEIDE